MVANSPLQSEDEDLEEDLVQEENVLEEGGDNQEETGHPESETEEEDDDDDEHVSDESSTKSTNRARTHVITRSRSANDLFVCDLDVSPANSRLQNEISVEQVRVQSNPEQDLSNNFMNSSTRSLKSLRDTQHYRWSTVHRRRSAAPAQKEPYNLLLQSSAEKVLSKLKNRQMVVFSQEKTVRTVSSRPPLIASMPRKLKPLLSGSESRCLSRRNWHDHESEDEQ